MFTGIIEQVGTISAVEPLGDSVRLTIDAPAILDGVALGDSIAVNGVCLTVTEHTATTFTADCMQETLEAVAKLPYTIKGNRASMIRK